MPNDAATKIKKVELATEQLYPRPPAKNHAERSMKRPWARQALLVALSAETLDSSGRKTKKLRIIIDRLVNAAMAGESWAIKEVLDRVDGKPTQTLAGDPDNPLGGQSVGAFIVEYVSAGAYDAPAQEPRDITPNKEAAE